MRLPTALMLPSAALLALLAGCDTGETARGVRDLPSETASYAAAHPPARPDRLLVTPPHPTPAFPQASSGPGTTPIVPRSVEPDVVSFIQRDLDRITQFINNGQLDRASLDLDGLDLLQPSWSRATQETLAPKITATRKLLDSAVRGSS